MIAISNGLSASSVGGGSLNVVELLHDLPFECCRKKLPWRRFLVLRQRVIENAFTENDILGPHLPAKEL